MIHQNASESPQPVAEAESLVGVANDALFGVDGATQRGFPTVSFLDEYDEECSLQISSRAVFPNEAGTIDDPMGWIWLGIDHAFPMVRKRHAASLGLQIPPGEVTGWMPYPIPDIVSISTRMHLNETQVRGLIVRLANWLETGEFSSPNNTKTMTDTPDTSEILWRIADAALGREAPASLLPNLLQPATKRSVPTTRVRYPDVMIDIEALAETPDAAVAQIGLVFFDRDDPGRAFLKCRYDPSPISGIRLGFIVTTATLQWWDDQGMAIDVQAGDPLPEVLDELAHDIRENATKSPRVWSRGNSYDLANLKLAYHRAGKALPWDFWNEWDVRTWLRGFDFKSPRKNDHDALQDAVNQAQDVVDATASGAGGNAKPEEHSAGQDSQSVADPLKKMAADNQRLQANNERIKSAITKAPETPADPGPPAREPALP